MREVEGIQFDWPEEDVAAMWRQIERNQKEFGKALGTSVKFAAWHLIRSLGKDTQIAPKYRKYEEIHETPKQRKKKGGGKKYRITTWKGGRKKTFNIRSPKGVQALKRMPQLRIGRRGLAKASWRFAVNQVGRKSGVGKVRGMTKGNEGLAKKYANVDKQLRGEDVYVTIHNKLDYIMDAMRGKESAVDTAMARAARGMSNHIDEQIRRKMGAK